MNYRNFDDEELERFAYLGYQEAQQELLARFINIPPEWRLERAEEAGVWNKLQPVSYGKKA